MTIIAAVIAGVAVGIGLGAGLLAAGIRWGYMIGKHGVAGKGSVDIAVRKVKQGLTI